MKTAIHKKTMKFVSDIEDEKIVDFPEEEWIHDPEKITALKEVPKDIFFEVIKDEFTVEDKIHDLLHLLLAKDKVQLEDLFTQARNKLEIVVTFLAILELIKLREIVAVQQDLFAPIIIARRESIYSTL